MNKINYKSWTNDSHLAPTGAMVIDLLKSALTKWLTTDCFSCFMWHKDWKSDSRSFTAVSKMQHFNSKKSSFGRGLNQSYICLMIILKEKNKEYWWSGKLWLYFAINLIKMSKKNYYSWDELSCYYRECFTVSKNFCLCLCFTNVVCQSVVQQNLEGRLTQKAQK